ncbi:hypothetical protein GCM10010981_26940 [Dyella nitratireducens]|uniref:Uncharacterized protein n=1 Tax=Dyella nitratireducens TaxID=1849580 RepID=A0ABQ1G5F7_9GAMM|nr:hypothetical protein GCM10010981_26940 [Dyella nitratireducens]GLQ41072.1 hypothetical protein GCM10007902_09220 [Dyella nitratireducens]
MGDVEAGKGVHGGVGWGANPNIRMFMAIKYGRMDMFAAVGGQKRSVALGATTLCALNA